MKHVKGLGKGRRGKSNNRYGFVLAHSLVGPRHKIVFLLPRCPAHGLLRSKADCKVKNLDIWPPTKDGCR
jgi:hypothetical protein